MGELSPWHWLIVLIVLALLFGGKRLPEAARSLGRSARILKAEMTEMGREPTPPRSPEGPPAAAPPEAPTAGGPLSQGNGWTA